MPEKTKLEDYANMNNTGFAFIDLNEELGIDYIRGEFGHNGVININKEINIDEKLYNKFYDIFESGKILFLKINLKLYFNVDFYQELINFKNAIVYKKDEENILHIMIYFGSTYVTDDEDINYNEKAYTYLDLSLYNTGINDYTLHVILQA